MTQPFASVVVAGPESALRVLVVDDDEVDRLIVRRALERGVAGTIVTETEGDGDTVAVIAAGGFDCVFLDYNLPRGNGLTVLRGCQAAGSTTPVIMLTGQGDEEVAVELMKAGAADYIPKSSLTPERLTRSLRYAVDISRAAAATRLAQLEMREAIESTRFLAEASRAMASSLDVGAVMRTVVDLCVPRLGEFCFIYTTLENGVRAVAAASSDPALGEVVHEFERVYVRGDPSPGSVVAAAMARRSTLSCDDIDGDFLRRLATDQHQLAVYQRLNPRSCVVVPLVGRDVVIGAVTFARTIVAPYAERDIDLAEDVGRRAANAMDNARLFALVSQAKQRAESAARRTERLQQLTAALAASPTERETGEILMQHGVLAAGADAGVIAEAVANGEELELFACIDYPDPACMVVGSRLPISAVGPLAEAARTGQPVLIESPEGWALRYPGAGTPATATGAWAAFPLHENSPNRGAILWSFSEPRSFPEEERRFMAAVAQQGSQALDRARLREAEKHARAAAEEANRAKSEFLARMSHDLRTPLNAIGGYAQLIEEGVYGTPTEGQRHSLLRIRRAQQHLLTLINDVLSFAKLEAGQVRVDIASVPVMDIVSALRSLIEPQVTAKGLRLGVRGVSEELVLRADAARVVQILGNLLTNAVKFTEPGGEVTLGWRREGEEIDFYVSDTGSGIPAERLQSIFDPFVQIEGPDSDTRQGVGLGLAIGRELARMLNGDLRVESQLGVGSTFTLRLPLDTAASPALALA